MSIRVTRHCRTGMYLPVRHWFVPLGGNSPPVETRFQPRYCGDGFCPIRLLLAEQSPAGEFPSMASMEAVVLGVVS